MKTFLDIERTLGAQPPRVGVLLGRVDVGKGSVALYRDQLPELLESLAELTRVESVRASKAIEGFEVDAQRAQWLVRQPEARVRNRNEREFSGYRDAIDEILRAASPERLSIPFVLHMHRQLYRHSGGGGGRFKLDPNRVVARDDAGRRVEIFAPPPPEQVESLMVELVDRYNAAADEATAHPLVLLAAFVLDLLAIHPVADGNGRLARLLTTHELLRSGYGVARYVSVEQRIYETRNSYYEALRRSQVGWHRADHDPWPWIEYLVSVLAEAYGAFAAKMADAQGGRGLTKQALVRRHVAALATGREFRMRDLRAALPGISDPTFRLVLVALKAEGAIEVRGSGRGAVWTRRDP